MSDFDIAGARKAGYSETEIADHLAFRKGFDIDSARKAGYDDATIINQLSARAAPMVQAPAAPQLSPADQGRQRVANEQSIGDAVLVGAGRTFNQVGAGMKQAWYGLTGNEKAQAELKAEQEDEKRGYDALQTARPIATSVGEALPSMVVPVGGAGGALATAGKLALSGAVPSALEYGTPEERAKRAAGSAAGAVIGGQVVPKLAGMAVEVGKAGLKGLAGKITPEAMALAARAKELGIPVNAAQLGDSKFLKTLASSIEQMPFTGGAKAAANQYSAYTNAVGKTFGADVDKITPEVYNFHKKRLGEQFEDLAARNNLDVNPALKSKLGGIIAEAESTASDDTIRAVKNIFSRVAEQSESQGGKVAAEVSPILNEAGEAIVKKAASETPVSTKLPGSAYSSIDSELGRIIKGGGEKGMYAKEMQKAIREAMDSSISPADQALWTETRNQYKNLKAVRDIVAKDQGGGNIPPTGLMNALNNTEAGKEAMAMGSRGTLGELGQIGKQFVRDTVPNSGTPQRLMAMGIIGGGGTLAGYDPATIAGMMAGGATTGRLLNKVMSSPKVIEALGKQGITLKELAKMPPSKITQILGGLSGMTVADQYEEN